jgi:hypothetical protein
MRRQQLTQAQITSSSMEELADRVGEPKAAKSDLDAYLERVKALFVASGREEAAGATSLTKGRGDSLTHFRYRR